MAGFVSETWILAVCAVAAGMTGLAWRWRWRDSAGLLAVALVGQAAALQLIFSPQNGMYQFFRPPMDVGGSWRVLCLIAVISQGLYVGWVGRGIWPRYWQHTMSILGPFQRLLLVLFLLNAGILVSTDGLQYGFGVFLVLWSGMAGALNLILVVRALPASDLETIKQRIGEWLAGPGSESIARRLPWMVAAWVLCVSSVIAWFVLDGVPHIQDSFAYFFQAKYFSAGHLFLPAPPDGDSFRLDHMINDGEKWYAYGFPGWPAVLALGVLVGAPWLVNPILGGVAVLLTHALLRRLYDIRLAHAVVLLLALSPWFLAMSANFMNHTQSLVLALLALLAMEQARKGAALFWGALAGMALGVLFLTRPIEGVMMSVVVGLQALGLGGPRPPLKVLVTIAIGAILVGGLIFPYNTILTGDPLYTPHQMWTESKWPPGVDRLGFGPEVGNVGWTHQDPLPGHGLADVILNANKNTHVINFELFGWSFGSLVFVALAFLFKAWSRPDLLLWGSVLVVVAGYSLYWSPGGPDFGSRYWYLTIIACVVFTVRGVQLLAEKLRDFDPTRLIGTRLVVFVAVASLTSFINVMPWRAMEKYHHYMRISADVPTLARAEGFDEGALVFVHARDSGHYTGEKDYAAAFVFNPPTLDGPDTVYARYEGAEKQAKVMAYFPDRPVWHIGISPEGDERYSVLGRPVQ